MGKKQLVDEKTKLNQHERHIMGQAKQRGTFEERRQQSIDRAEAERAERQRKAQEWWNSLTPEQQEAERVKRRRRSGGMNAMAMWILPAIMMDAAADEIQSR